MMKNLFNRRKNYKDLDDKDLVELAKEDKEAFGELYERYMPKIYNYIYYRTSNQHDAEDLTARVFFRAMSHIGNYVDKGVPFQAWLYRIAHNLVANWHRDQGRRKVIALDDYVAHSLKSDAPDRLAEEMEDQLSNAEIGEIMDRTEGAIKSLYHRTLLSLRDELQMQEHQATNRRKKRNQG